MKDPNNPTKYNTNRGIMALVYVMLAVFVALIVYLLVFQIFQADEVINNSYNKRQDILAGRNVRGDILAADGTSILARTVTNVAGEEERDYPYGPLFAHVVGYIGNGGAGLESSAAYYMLTSDQNIFNRIANAFSGEKNAGNSLVTTLDLGLQQACYDALAAQNGSVIVTEPSTGKILAMVSKPDFDPNTIDELWDSITADEENAALYNRATQGLYPPGSTFKLVTLLAYYREHPDDYAEYAYTCEGSIEVDGNVISCLDGHVHGTQDLFASFANSCNTSFINIGLVLKRRTLIKTAKDMLFNEALPLTLSYKPSEFALTESSSDWEVAQTAFGQGETLISPIHLALIGSAIANDGVLMKPYLIDKITNNKGVVTKSFAPKKAVTMMSEKEADFLTEAMANMVETSLDWLYGGSNYTVAAKTGTAQFDNSTNYHSLFVSFSPVEDPEIAVTVVLEGNNRNEAASECAKQIYDFYYANKE